MINLVLIKINFTKKVLLTKCDISLKMSRCREMSTGLNEIQSFQIWHHLLKPVGNRHHDIKRSQEEDKVKVRVAIDSCLSLVIHHVLACTSFLLIIEI